MGTHSCSSSESTTGRNPAGPSLKRPSGGVRRPAGHAPLSYTQQRLWFLERLEPGLPAYTVPFAWRLTGPLDAAALGRALLRLVERHDALRTVFPVADGEPVQRVQPAGDVPLAVEDLADLPPPQREARLADWPAAEAARPFDLEHGPMFRAGPACLGPAEHVLLLNMHHIVCDGWSLAVLAEELGAVYAAEASGAVPDLPPPPMRFADSAARQRCGDGPPARAMAYWRQRPAGLAAVPVLPADRPRPATRTRRCHCIPVTLPAELTARLTELGRGADGVGRGGVWRCTRGAGGDPGRVGRDAGAHRLLGPRLPRPAPVGRVVRQPPAPPASARLHQIRELFSRMTGQAWAGPTFSEVDPENVGVRDRVTELMPMYRLGPFAGPVTLLRCVEPLDWTGVDWSDPLSGWGTVLGDRLRVVPRAGHHHSVLGDNLPDLARRLQECLDESDAVAG